MSNELIAQVLGVVCGGVDVYAGIRADLAAMHAKVDMVIESLARAHQRIDEISGGGK